jgi:hypothetical protein
MELYFEKTPHLVPQFFTYRRKQLELWKDVGNRVSCRDLFRKFHILPLTSQYLLSLLMFVVQHKDIFIKSMEGHNLDTRQSNNLYTPQANFQFIKKEPIILG